MEFSRILWVSQAAKDLWAPRITSVERAFVKAEVQAVYKNMRRATIQSDKWWKNPGDFVTLGLDTVKDYTQYSARAEAPEEGEPFSVRTVTLHRTDVNHFLDIWYSSDDDMVGVMLGYPACCVHFFRMTWMKGIIDPTSEMADGDGYANPYSNSLLRWTGVRPVPHMPCGFGCKQTIEQGEKFMSLMPEEERGWALELLSMPMHYSTLHGVAEISTPLFKLACTSQGTRDIKLRGRVPDGTVGGTGFPFIPDTWTMNGFVGPASMESAHKSVLECVRCTGFAVDFGCGNGKLLASVPAEEKLGIDTNMEAIRNGRLLYGPGLSLVPGDFNQLPIPPHTLSIISIERLVESPNPGALIQKLAHEAVVYAYSDGLDQFDERVKTYFGDWQTTMTVQNKHAKVVRLYK